MHNDVRGASRRKIRKSLRLRLRGRRAAMTTLAATVAGALILIGIAPAFASTPTPTPTPDTSEVAPAPSPSESIPETPTPEPQPSVSPESDVVSDDSAVEDETVDQPSTQIGARFATPDETAGVSLLAASAIPQGGAAINVNLRALRVASGSSTTTSPTAGVQLMLYVDSTVGSGGNAYSTPGAAVADPWGTCTTDAAGDCTFTVPSSQVNKSYWVMASSAGALSFLSQHFITGDNTNTGTDRFAATPYSFRTPVIAASQTVYQLPGTGLTNMPAQSRVGNPGLPVAATVSTANRWAHYSGDMITTMNNPRYQPTCQAGLKVALIIDTSTSMTYNNNEGINGAKTASVAFATQFANKDVTLGVYRFGNNAATVKAPVVVTSNTLSSFTSAINGISIGNSEYTNWDAGIDQIKSQGYDLAVVLTDGNPTRSSEESAGGSWTNLIRLEAAVLSANLVKSQGTQMLAFGVGDYIASSLPQNLESVTGKTAWTPNGGVQIGKADYAITSDWGVVSTQLASLASSLTCEATVQIHKQERKLPNGPLTDGSGWRFTPEKTGSGTLTPSTFQDTGANGYLPNGFRIAFTATNQTAALKVTETQKTGWSLESVSCVNNGVPIAGIANSLAITLPNLTTGDNVVCTVVNAETPKAATVVVNKVWTIKDSAGATIGTYKQPAQVGDPALPQGLGATPSVAGVERVWGTVYTGFTQLQKVAIAESVTLDTQQLPGCTLTSKKLTAANGQTLSVDVPYEATLALGANSYTLTNTVTCAQTLSLVKTVAFGSAPTDTWTLTGTAPAGALEGPSGKYTTTGSVSKPVTAGAAYALKESGGPAEYVQDGVWSCVTGTTSLTVTDAKVTVPLGANVTCTVTNTTAKLVLLKHVTDQSLKPGDWTLTAQPGAAGLATRTAVGAESAASANTFEIKPNTAYTISEALTGGPGTIAYRQIGIEQLQPDGVTWLPVTTDQVTVQPGKQATYRFVNDKVPAVVLPLTGGASTDAFLFGGIIAILLAAILAVWQIRRTIGARLSRESTPS